jgi:ATP-binding cassette subfamily C protein LapB
VTTGSLSSVAYVSALVVGVYQIEAGNLTMGALIACSILGGRVIAPIAQGVQHMVNWQNVSESLQMVDQLLELATEREPDQSLLIPDSTPQQIALEQVHFSYPNSPIKQLDVDSLSINAGDKVLLLGPIGSGKSTLLKVLAGLYRPSGGRVQLGDVDLWQLDPVSVAEHVAYLPQNVHLFKGTLHSNLALSGMVGDEALIEVSQDLGIDKIAVDSSKGFDLEISEGGEGLSGGQQQLVGLARVLLAKPKIWLLDEPTASLDNQSDQQVMQALKKHIADDDIVVIASHRQAWATEFANRVMLMRDGRIIDDGKPEQVLTKLLGQRGTNRPAAVKQGNPRVI